MLVIVILQFVKEQFELRKSFSMTSLRERSLSGYSFGNYTFFLHFMPKDKSRKEKKIYFLYLTPTVFPRK